MAQGNQFFQILLCTESRVNLVVIRHVVFMIGRRKKHRRQPDAFDAEAVPGRRVSVVQVIHPVDHAPQIADSVPVGIGKGTDKNLIEHAAVVFHVQPFLFRGHGGAQQKQCQ